MEAFVEQYFKDLKVELEEITSATNNFDDNNLIGGGGFGKVYKGALARYKDRSLVAFKRLDRKYGQGNAEFLKEITFLTRYKHENLISLLGFCIHDKEMILVYEHAYHGSLDRHLNSAHLTWKQRLKICLDAAKGLNHLHDPRETSQRIIHCDIKSANILLDDQWNAKVADFGLSKIGPANEQNSILVTNTLGTYGYCDPLFMETYSLTKESDVYSFGVVLFEVLCGKLCFEKTPNGHTHILVPMWKKSYQENKLAEIIFQDLRQNMDPTALERFSEIASQCLKKSREERPLMSLVVKELETALKCQDQLELQLLRQEVKEYEEILNAAVTPLIYTSIKELKVLLYKGLLVNGGKMWFSMNENGEHCELISIKKCIRYIQEDHSDRYSHEYNSRFAVGTYNTQGKSFKTRVITQFLSPFITYTVNLIFKCPHMLKGKQRYISLTYELKQGQKKISIVHTEDKREDEWLMARLYQFTTSHQSIVNLTIVFERHENSLQVEGIEFQPNNVKMEDDEELVLDDKYKEIVKSTKPPLFYRSVQELNLLLSKGVILNKGNTWFYLNDKRQHCEMISIKQCLIPVAEKRYDYYSHFNSRFVVGSYLALDCKFRTHVRAQFLSPGITYTVNLVFKVYESEGDRYTNHKQADIGLKYKLAGDRKTLNSNLADKREDDWWMVELFQFTSEQGTTSVDLEIIFEGNLVFIVVEGIEFLPVELEKAEHHVLEETQPISSSDSDSDTYWEHKVPNDYQDIIKFSKDSMPMNTTKRELHLVLSKGFLIHNGQEWLSLDKYGKKCLMQSPRVAIDAYDLKWQSLPGSRFGEMMESRDWKFKIVSEMNSKLLESETRYATYLVYKLPESDQYTCEAHVEVKNMGNQHFWYIYLVSPQSPVINVRGGKVVDGIIRRNPLNRPKIKDGDVSQQRSDGWREVQVWEFQTAAANADEMIIPNMHLNLSLNGTIRLGGVIIQGIEFRPIYIG